MNEFHELDPVEKMWWIKYAKLELAWNELFPDTEFPAEMMDGPLLTKPWEDPFHYINHGLKVAEEEIEKMMVDWNRIQVTNNVVFCRYDAHSCKCDNCNYRFKCGLRGE